MGEATALLSCVKTTQIDAKFYFPVFLNVSILSLSKVQ